MFASTPKRKATASAGLVVRIHKILVTLATNNFNQIGLNLNLERISLECNKLATTPINAKWLAKVKGLALTKFEVCVGKVTIQ
jgi:hypothetical protein